MSNHQFKCFIIAVLSFLFQVSYAQEIDFTDCPTGKERVTSSNSSFEKEVLSLVNKERKKRKMKPLEWNNQLAYAARYHAKDMIVDNYFDHETKDRKGHRLKRACGIFDRLGKFMEGSGISPKSENIAVGAIQPQEVVKDWMKSQGQRQNILDREARYLGVAYLRDANSEWGTYWVQCFGS